MAGQQDTCQLFVFWGGEVSQFATPPQLTYSIPANTVIPIHVQIPYDFVVVMIRHAMGISSSTNIELTRRLLFTSAIGMTHIAYHITTAEEWQYFVQQSFPLGDLHVYVRQITQQVSNVAAFAPNEPYTDLSNFGAAIQQHVDFCGPSTSIHPAMPSIPGQNEPYDSTNSEPEPILSQPSASSDDDNTDGHFSLEFDYFEQADDTFEEEPTGGKRIPDHEIPYYHATVPYSTAYTEQEETQTTTYDPSTNVLKVGMVFTGFEQLKKAVTLFNIWQQRTF